MLTFSIRTQIVIETIASIFLLFCAGYMMRGVLEGQPTKTGVYILLAFSIIFGVGGIAGLLKCIKKYRKYKGKDQKPK